VHILTSSILAHATVITSANKADILSQNSQIFFKVSIILHTPVERTCEDNSSGVKITSQLARPDGKINH